MSMPALQCLSTKFVQAIQDWLQHLSESDEEEQAPGFYMQEAYNTMWALLQDVQSPYVIQFKDATHAGHLQPGGSHGIDDRLGYRH